MIRKDCSLFCVDAGLPLFHSTKYKSHQVTDGLSFIPTFGAEEGLEGLDG